MSIFGSLMPSAGKFSLSNLMLDRECLTQARSALGRSVASVGSSIADHPSAEWSRRSDASARHIKARRQPKELQHD
jgi:hypothetical protein